MPLGYKRKILFSTRTDGSQTTYLRIINFSFIFIARLKFGLHLSQFHPLGCVKSKETYFRFILALNRVRMFDEFSAILRSKRFQFVGIESCITRERARVR